MKILIDIDAGPVPDKCYYLIEHDSKWWDGTLHKGVSVDCRFFTSDPNKAKRFDNKVEPQLIIERFGNSCQSVTEHMWVDMPRPPECLQAEQYATQLKGESK